MLTADTETCYFPVEFHGTYQIQTQSGEYGAAVTYSEISIVDDAIPPWGKCFKRKGNQVILKDSDGAQDCMRCLHISLKTPNVIQIHSEGECNSNFNFLLSLSFVLLDVCVRQLMGSAFPVPSNFPDN